MYGTTYETVRFEQVSRRAEKTVKCAKCGKRLQRQRTFSQTINPWNRTADGRVKSREEIVEELRERIKHWQAEPETCSKCEAASQGR